MTLNATTSLIFTKANFKFGLLLVAAAILSACSGGGNSSTSTSTSTGPLALNLNAAFEKKTVGGSSISGTISGYCQGSRIWTLGATSSGKTDDGKPALIQNEYELDNLVANSNAFCTNFYKSNNINTVKATNYYDPNTLVPISSGSPPPTTVYQNQVSLPTSVTAGSSGSWFNTISEIQGGIPAMTSFQTWAVTADSSTTLTLITNNKAYTTAGNELLFNQTTWYRINSDNTLTSLRKNIQVTPLGIFVFSGATITVRGDQNVDEVYQQPISSPTLNLNAAYTTQVKGGSTITGTIFGYCQGTRQQTFTPTVSGKTLSGGAALITYETETDAIPASSNAFCKGFYKYDGSTSTPYYFDTTNVTPISSGATQNGYPLGLVWSNQSAPPSSVTVGASGTLATYVNYSSNPIAPSGPTVPVEYGSRTWNIIADTPTTLMYVTTDTAKVYGTDALIYTSITNYRINANNTLTALYKEVQATNIATQGQGYQTIFETYK